MKYRIRMCKCYQVAVIDEDGYEVETDYVFCTRKEYAKRRAEKLKKEVEERTGRNEQE